MTVRHFGEASAFNRRETAVTPDRRLWEGDRSRGPTSDLAAHKGDESGFHFPSSIFHPFSI
jgi:hypothetical protein